MKKQSIIEKLSPVLLILIGFVAMSLIIPVSIFLIKLIAKILFGTAIIGLYAMSAVFIIVALAFILICYARVGHKVVSLLSHASNKKNARKYAEDVVNQHNSSFK